jgi:hypothetical protein
MTNILPTIQQQIPHLVEVSRLLLALQPFSDQQFVDSLERYCGFLLLLNHYPHLKLVPTCDIDFILHIHLAHPNHQQDWYQLFGDAELIHTPDRAHLADFAQTKTLFEQEFNLSYGWQAAACDVFL